MPLPAIIHTQAYRKAFDLYLRRGIPIELPLKAALQEHPTTHYIWRTRGDNKVRASHAANNGRIFSWDNPPPTAHPGEDYGCRCWAQPILVNAGKAVIFETLDQQVASIVDEGLSRWEWYDFVIHFYFGGGKAVELANIGHLQDVIDRANERRLHPHQVFEGVEAQVCNNARAVMQGIISDTFAGTYNFRPVSFVHRISTVKGSFTGSAQKENDYLIISADVSYEFSDIFTDPLDIIQLITGTPKELFAFIGKLAMARNLRACRQLTQDVIPGVRRARKTSGFLAASLTVRNPGTRKLALSNFTPGYRTARFSMEIKDFRKNGFRYDNN